MDKKNTFLTGVNIYQVDPPKPEPREQLPEPQPLDSNMLHEVSAIRTDDL